MTTKTIPFFSKKISLSDSGRSVVLFFADRENRGIRRRVCIPLKSVKIHIRKGYNVFNIPYWFLKDKGLDTITAKGQMKWGICR